MTWNPAEKDTKDLLPGSPSFFIKLFIVIHQGLIYSGLASSK